MVLLCDNSELLRLMVIATLATSKSSGGPIMHVSVVFMARRRFSLLGKTPMSPTAPMSIAAIISPDLRAIA